jgi:four helix bundle protein
MLWRVAHGNFEIQNSKSETNEDKKDRMEEGEKRRGDRPYDLEERTELFAREVRTFVKKISRTIANLEDGKQLIRSSGSVGANYIEANESLGKKDFLLRIKMCRKEAKESAYWLRLLDLEDDAAQESGRRLLAQEAAELTNIFGAILRKNE